MRTEAENNAKVEVDGTDVSVDPMTQLVKSVESDPGAAFTPDAIIKLAELKRTDTASYERTRNKLKDLGVRVGELDRLVKAQMQQSSSRAGDDDNRSQSEILIEIADGAELFHTPDRKSFATIVQNDHLETWAVRSVGFGQWLRHQYFLETGQAPNSEAFSTALNTIEAKAIFAGAEQSVFLRVGTLEEKHYIDLGDDEWRAIEIDTEGWRIVDDSPIRFRRSNSMRPLPVPKAGGAIFALKGFINVATEEDFILIAIWLLAALRSHGPYPVLVLLGEQGSAKSSAAKILRGLVDPNTAPLRTLPRDATDLFVSAQHGHVLVFDNISYLPGWMSDLLCRLATGAGFAKRQLYTDSDEIIIEAARPIILNGIEDVVSRADLADRTIFIRLEAIPEESRRTDQEIVDMLEQASPEILGVLLDGLVHALQNLPNTKLERLPRMADFALLGAAGETAFFDAGKFMAAYEANRDYAVETMLEINAVGPVLRSFMANTPTWSGTATDLLSRLQLCRDSEVVNGKNWPKTPQHLSGHLRRAATFLRRVGIDIQSDRDGHEGTRMLTITNTKFDPKSSSAASAPSATKGRNGPDVHSKLPCADAADAADDEIQERAGDEGKNGFRWNGRV